MNPLLEKEVEAFDEIAKNGRYSSYVVDRFCCGGDYCTGDHNGWIRDYFTQALERAFKAGEKNEGDRALNTLKLLRSEYMSQTPDERPDCYGAIEDMETLISEWHTPNQTQL